MRKVRCPICEQKRMFKDRDFLITHIEKYHKDNIPAGWDAGRYENFLRTGKEHGTCVICKGKTDWNPNSKKYYRMCGSAACKKKAADIAEANMKKATGMTKSERMKDPNVQVKMIYSKHTSGKYTAGGHDIWYDSSYSREFVEDVLDHFLNYDMKDVFGPSLNTYTYMFEGKEHTYIPDYCILSCGLEIEIKDGGDNPNMHPKIQAVDKKKEEAKDKVMYDLQSKGKIRYVKIVNKDYTEFFKVLMEIKNQYDSDNIIKRNNEKDVQLVDEGVVDLAFDIATGVSYAVDVGKEVIYQDNVIRGKSTGYHQLIEYYHKEVRKVKNMTDFNRLEWQMRHTYDALIKKKEFQKQEFEEVEYDLERTIKDMEDGVFREFELKKNFLIKKEERKMKQNAERNNNKLS